MLVNLKRIMMFGQLSLFIITSFMHCKTKNNIALNFRKISHFYEDFLLLDNFLKEKYSPNRLANLKMNLNH